MTDCCLRDRIAMNDPRQRSSLFGFAQRHLAQRRQIFLYFFGCAQFFAQPRETERQPILDAKSKYLPLDGGLRRALHRNNQPLGTAAMRFAPQLIRRDVQPAAASAQESFGTAVFCCLVAMRA